MHDDDFENDLLPDELAQKREADQEKKVDDEDVEKPKEEVEPEDASKEDEPDGADPEEDGESDEEQEEPTPAQKRRARQKAKRSAEQAELKDLRERVKTLEVSKPEPQAGVAAPKEEDYTDYNEFLKDHTTHIARQAAREEAAVLRQEAQAAGDKTESDRVLNDYEGRREAARERYSDYDEVAHADELPVTEEMAQVIMTSEKGPDIAYFLGSHPEQAAKIAALPSIQAAMELGRIEASLTLPKARTETKARKPLKTVSGGDIPAKNLSEMSMDDYRKAREKKKG